MAITPKEAFNFINEKLNNEITQFEKILDNYLSNNYINSEIEISLKDLFDEGSENSNIYNKSFFNQKVINEISRRYSQWNVSVITKQTKGLTFVMSEKEFTDVDTKDNTSFLMD